MEERNIAYEQKCNLIHKRVIGLLVCDIAVIMLLIGIESVVKEYVADINKIATIITYIGSGIIGFCVLCELVLYTLNAIYSRKTGRNLIVFNRTVITEKDENGNKKVLFDGDRHSREYVDFIIEKATEEE